ncbi:hypothetical protein MA04_03915 [Alcanivorax balearicus MACL04]|uniref:Uncharacterized protein n=2 Tax=Alloalcanivorax TaxID=3020832 RepID=A0A9Q3W9D3_9GAMM|nr:MULTISPECIES: hypothetical protein [Alloalcanivorax]MCE7511009.1 hypothetical protein [Alloalcanivorax xenomutans]MCU5784615.1 hypothetical protein [Alloalcanivorax balearicus MACL04]
MADTRQDRGRANTEPHHFDVVRRQLNAPPHWANQTLQAWSAALPQEKKPFVTRHYWSETGSVNVFRVVGTDHQDHHGKTWLQLLTGGKRMPHNLQWLHDNPDYYLAPQSRAPRLFYSTVDGLDFYVGADGNHRTCLARFFLAEHGLSQLHDVTVNHYHVDELAYQIWQRAQAALHAQRQPITVIPRPVQAGRDDTPGWKLDHYQLAFEWRDLDTDQDDILDRDAFIARCQDLAIARFKPAAPSHTTALRHRIASLFKRS